MQDHAKYFYFAELMSMVDLSTVKPMPARWLHLFPFFYSACFLGLQAGCTDCWEGLKCPRLGCPAFKTGSFAARINSEVLPFLRPKACLGYTGRQC
jgi:hypothetical protein